MSTIGYCNQCLLCAGPQKPLLLFLRVLLVLPLFCGCFATRESRSASWHGFYAYTARALACLALFCFANVLKSLGAKLLAGSFHKVCVQLFLHQSFPPVFRANYAHYQTVPVEVF